MPLNWTYEDGTGWKRLMEANGFHDLGPYLAHNATGKEGIWRVSHPHDDGTIDLVWRPHVPAGWIDRIPPHYCLTGYEFARFDAGVLARRASEIYENPPEAVPFFEEQLTVHGFEQSTYPGLESLWKHNIDAGVFYLWAKDPSQNENGWWHGSVTKLEYHTNRGNRWYNLTRIEVMDERNMRHGKPLFDAPIRPSKAYALDPRNLDVFVQMQLFAEFFEGVRKPVSKLKALQKIR